MASITAPTSLQIRLAFSSSNCCKLPFLIHSRLPCFNRRLRILCVAKNGNGLNTVPAQVGSDEYPDLELREQPTSTGSNKKNQSNGGVVGTGVAGLLLLSGLTFAALFLSRRFGPRQEQQMKALTAHQEVILPSDEHNDGTEHVNAYAGNMVEQGNGDMEGRIDTSGDSNIGSKLVYDDIHNMYTDNDATMHLSVQEELHHGSAVNGRLVVPSEDVSESENPVDSFDGHGFRNFDSSTSVDTANSITEFEENPFSVEPRNTCNFDDESLNLVTEQQNEISGSNGNSSGIFNTSSFVADNESIPVNIEVRPQSNKTTSDPKVFPEDAEGNALSVSTKENLDLNKMPQVLANSSLEEQSFLENDLLTESSVVSTNTYIDEQVRNSNNNNNNNNEVNKRRSESPNSGAFYSAPGIPAPSEVSAAVQVLPGKVLVPASVDQVQGQALAALQALKIIEPDVQSSDLCTRREYARWLVSTSSTLSRKTISKVYPAMYIDNVTELAFDDITPEDPDFPSIQGLAEAGLIESRLSKCGGQVSANENYGPFFFFPESPLSRQDLVSWKLVLERRQLPEADRKMLYQLSGFIDADKIHSDACPALVADVSAGEHGIIALAFGYTRLFQPHKPVTKAQAAIALATGDASDVLNEELLRIEAESMAENAVATHSALVAQVEKDIKASFEQKLSMEWEKINAVERMAEEARWELERLRAEREEDRISLIKQRAAIESERDVFSRLRYEVEDQLQNLMNNKVEIAYEKERISKLRELADIENKEITQLHYELEVERKALSMARAWAEDEAKRVGKHAEALERARDRWEKNGIKVVVDDDFHDEDSAGVTWVNTEEQFSVKYTIDRADNLLDKLKKMAAEVGGRARNTIDKIIHIISQFVSRLWEWACKTGKQAEELREAAISKAGKSAHDVQQSALEFGFAIKEGAKRVAGDCREGIEKLTQKFRT